MPVSSSLFLRISSSPNLEAEAEKIAKTPMSPKQSIERTDTSQNYDQPE
jgi:hypothetical protein